MSGLRSPGLGALPLERRAQATLEMAIVAPVLIVLALVAYNLMVYASAVARFDRVAPDIVLAHAVSPVGDGGEDVIEVIENQLDKAMSGYGVAIGVALDGEDGRDPGSALTLVGTMRTYRCSFEYVPWPTDMRIAGVDMGSPASLHHERAVVIDPWRPGVVV